MSVEVTLKLPESLIEYAKLQAGFSQREVEEVLADTLEILWLTWENLPNSHLSQPVTSLSENNRINAIALLMRLKVLEF